MRVFYIAMQVFRAIDGLPRDEEHEIVPKLQWLCNSIEDAKIIFDSFKKTADSVAKDAEDKRARP